MLLQLQEEQVAKKIKNPPEIEKTTVIKYSLLFLVKA
jgi:hypothetical protein